MASKHSVLEKFDCRVHCLQQAFVFNERVKFNKAVQTDAKNVTEWLARVMSLAVSCDFGTQLDSMLKDRFVSGLTDRRMVSTLCGEIVTSTLRQLVDSATTMKQRVKPRIVGVKPSTSAQNLIPRTCKVKPESPKTADVLGLPEEILIKIILYLNPRERLPLGNSCRKFNSLVFDNEEVLRKLDFSIDGSLTAPSDIHQYFENETARHHIRELNLKNVKFLKPGPALSNSIGKVMNLVDMNSAGIVFKDIQQLASLLNPLVYLKGLSIYWQITGTPSHHWYKLLEQPFSGLTYLSVNVPYESLDKFCSCLYLCKQLRRLCLQVIEGKSCNYRITERLKVLKNLGIVEFCGGWTNEMKKQLITMLPEPRKWTDFDMKNQDLGFEWDFYLEKNVEVCKELVGGQWMKAVPNATWKDFGLGWALIPELLLKRVLELTHEDVPQTLCCLSRYKKYERCLLTMKEAKRLLKDPWYQVKYLYVDHDVEIGCDIHLIASAFQHLTELRFCHVASSKMSIQSEPPSLNQLRRKGCAGADNEKQDNSLNYSSFRMLVENTPHLRIFSLDVKSSNFPGDSPWDMDPLYQIARWKNLRTLRLSSLPSNVGKYLIEIGKQCTQLQRLELQVMRTPNPRHFTEDLIQMLPLCQNLTTFYIMASNLGLPLSDVFNTLANNKQLAIVDAYNYEYDHYTASTLVSSFEKLLHSCSGMTRFNCQIRYTNKADFKELSSGVQRLKRQLSRSNLQILVACSKEDLSVKEIGSIPEDILEFTLFSHLSPIE